MIREKTSEQLLSELKQHLLSVGLRTAYLRGKYCSSEGNAAFDALEPSDISKALSAMSVRRSKHTTMRQASEEPKAKSTRLKTANVSATIIPQSLACAAYSAMRCWFARISFMGAIGSNPNAICAKPSLSAVELVAIPLTGERCEKLLEVRCSPRQQPLNDWQGSSNQPTCHTKNCFFGSQNHGGVK